ncbi:MAG: AAA family ATPase [Patescibacteria group bacterium]
MKNSKIIIGLVGEIASGKDTVAAYLKKKYKSETISFSQPLRNILDVLFLSQTRESMSWLGTILRGRFGQNLLAKVITQKAEKSKSRIVVIPNVRLPQDIVFLKRLPHFVLVGIDTNPKIRYQRLTKRRQNADDKNKTWKQFLKDAKLPTETKIRKLIKKSRIILDNNGDFKDLYLQVEKMLKKYV